MPFELTNVLATLWNFINNVLRLFLDIFCTTYLDDILIYSDNIVQHRLHVYQVIEALRETQWYLKLKKCQFHTTIVHHFGLIMTLKEMSIHSNKIKVVKKWSTIVNVSNVQAFFRFVNFYSHFILGYASIVFPWTKFTGKNIPFKWTDDCEFAFQKLKTAFTSAPILRHFDPKCPCIAETDTSD